MALADAEKKLKNVMKKLDSVSSNFITEKESWEKNMASVEENWRCKMLIYLLQKYVLSFDGKW